MATPSEKLAHALEQLKHLQEHGTIAIQAKQLTRSHRECLIKNGFLEEVIKGWYIPTRPDEIRGESTAWYASFWGFCASYLKHRFQNDWCLSPEQSLLLHAENWTVPKQLFVRSSKGNNKLTKLLHNTSLLDARYRMPAASQIVEKNGIRIFALVPALIYSSTKFFTQYSTDVRAALSIVRESSEVLHFLLEEGHSTIAGKLCGAWRSIGYERIADEIKKTMISAGYDIRESNPFTEKTSFIFTGVERSPYVNRMRALWHDMRQSVIAHFPAPDKRRINIERYLKQVDENYLMDAYHSLSIEGYQVSIELIEKVRSGKWNPDSNQNDRNHRNALAARGYWQAFNEVKASIHKVLQGLNPGEVVDYDHSGWYRAMFQPSIVAGILKPSDLAGYRNSAVFIRRSMHVPPRCEAVRDLMPAFFQCLREETEASVRIVLGHFFFVYIHPYMDGNGRIGRFLMNTMLAAGGYPWTVIPVELRDEYMSALEEASVRQDILPFCKFIGSCVNEAFSHSALLDQQSSSKKHLNRWIRSKYI